MELEASSFSVRRKAPLLEQLGLQGESYEFSASGRSSLGAILDALGLRETSVLIPDFYCHSSISSVLSSRSIRPLHYPLNPDLTPDSEAIVKALSTQGKTVGAVLLVSFFGVMRPEQAAMVIREFGSEVPIILDSVQDLQGAQAYGETSAWAPWQFYSFRKFLPVPEGGVAVGPGLGSRGVSGSLSEATLLSLAQMSIRGLAQQLRDRGENAADLDRVYWNLRAREPEVKEDEGLSTISAELGRLIDCAEAFTRRRSNYEHLESRLNLRGIHPLMSIPASSAPLVLPVLVQGGRRHELQTELRRCGVLAPRHWVHENEFREQLGPYSRSLNQEILSLPIDQRYGPDEMDYVVAVIKKVLA